MPSPPYRTPNRSVTSASKQTVIADLIAWPMQLSRMDGGDSMIRTRQDKAHPGGTIAETGVVGKQGVEHRIHKKQASIAMR